MKKLLAFFLLGVGMALAAGPAAHAQPNNGGPGADPDPVEPTTTPIDGGASLLLAGGIGYAVRRLRQRRQAAR